MAYSMNPQSSASLQYNNQLGPNTHTFDKNRISVVSCSKHLRTNKNNTSFVTVSALSRANSFKISALHKPHAAVVTKDSWERLILNSELPVLVEFYASWCGPCRMVHRIIDEIAAEYSGKLKCFVLDADNDTQIAEDYDIKVVPVVVLIKNGIQRKLIAGTMPKEFYVDAIERILKS